MNHPLELSSPLECSCTYPGTVRSLTLFHITKFSDFCLLCILALSPFKTICSKPRQMSIQPNRNTHSLATLLIP